MLRMKTPIAFLLGFAFGVATVVTFRHEVALKSQTHTFIVLIGLGLCLAVVLLGWLAGLLRKENEGSSAAIETSASRHWHRFIWSSCLLLMIYLFLVVLFLKF